MVEVDLGDVKVGKYAFQGCDKLKELKMAKNGITDIAEGAFENCTALENVEIPSNVTDIKKLAFNNCTNLKSVKLPENINSIEDLAFARCGLENLEINSGTIGYRAFWLNQNLKNVKIGNKVSSIESAVFEECKKIETITIEEGSTLTVPSDNWGASNATVDKK